MRTGQKRPAADDVPAISLERVGKRYGTVVAIKELSLDIADNEFFTLLGPSGCGKTTLLRMIAGFEATSAGSIRLYGDDIGRLSPNRRPVNTVFQSYALFPHMSVAENVGFGLQMLGRPAADIAPRVTAMLEMVKLDQLAERRPAQLSGGQQQRVALARAMAPEPKVLLLDEPLSALDLKLRQAMRAELKTLQRESGITFVFVTHDQEEALSMSDRIAVMSAGEVQQIGSPTEIYDRPANRFVADFIGEINCLAATVTGSDGEALVCRLDAGPDLAAGTDTARPVGTRGWICLRPERLALGLPGQHGDARAALVGTVGASMYLGTDHQVSVHLDDGEVLSARLQSAGSDSVWTREGERVEVTFDAGSAWFLDR